MDYNNLIDDKINKNVLSIEEKTELFQLYKLGDMNARNQLIVHNLGLIHFTIVENKYATNDDEMDELFSIGTFPLIKAIETFDINRGVKFSTYACTCIRNFLGNYIRDQKKKSKIIIQSIDKFYYPYDNGVPVSLHNILHDYSDITENFDNKEVKEGIQNAIKTLTSTENVVITSLYGFDGNIKSSNKIAEDLGVTRSYVNMVNNEGIRKIKKSLYERGLFLKSVETLNKTNELFKLFPNYSEKDILKAVDLLKDDKKEIIELRFGLKGNCEHTKKEIGEKLNIESAYVNRVINAFKIDAAEFLKNIPVENFQNNNVLSADSTDNNNQNYTSNMLKIASVNAIDKSFTNGKQVIKKLNK